MERIKAITKKWGNSFAVILPKKLVDTQRIEEGTEITITIEPIKKTRVKDIFGIMKEKLKRNTQQVMDEIDRDFWPEEE